MDISAEQPRFLLHHVTWGWPFRWPKVTEFAVASEEDGLLWELKSADETGRDACQLAIVFGEVPPGFVQVVPAGDGRARPLVSGRSYFVGATGPDSIYRVVFAMPVGRFGVPADAGLLPGVRRNEGVRSDPPTSAKPAD